MPKSLPANPSPRAGAWVQTDRASHEAWAQLAVKSPKAAALLHILAARVGEHNAVVASHGTLAEIMGCSKETIKRAIKELRLGSWIEVGQIGPTGTANAYILNSHVVWSGPREGLRNALFSATVILSSSEQADVDALDRRAPLKPLPRMYEQQLPTGAGLAPPSEPALPGLEPDLPAIDDRRSGEDARPIGDIMQRFNFGEPS